MQAKIPLSGGVLFYKRQADNYLLISGLARTNGYKPIPKRYDP
jgi:hypothetical protein